MKLIIDINSMLYDFLNTYPFNFNSPSLTDYLTTSQQHSLVVAIRNAKPYDDSGDLISREALKTELETYRHTRNYKSDEDEAQNNLLDNILEDIDNAPPVETFTLEDMRNNYDAGVESIVGKYDEAKGELWNCRNELCLRCGKYEKAYLGACNDCRYNDKNMEQYKRGDDK